MNKRTLKKLLEEIPDGCLDETELDFGPDVGQEAVWSDDDAQELCKIFGRDGLKDDVFDESVFKDLI